MQAEIYYGDLKECIYTGFAGNITGADHDRIIQQGIYFVKINSNEYMCVDELLSNKKHKKSYKNYATKVGDVFVSNLILINDLIEKKQKTMSR